jgi:hypothetical protein
VSQESLKAKSQSLESSFFRQRDQALLEFLRSSETTSDPRQQLQAASKVDDPKVLEALVQLGVTAESMTAFSLLPLLRVAWADGQIQENERLAILQAARENGISEETPSFQLLEGWLEDRPEPELLEAWIEYAKALSRSLDPESFSAIQTQTLEQARKIAISAGGILGLGNRIHQNEQRVLRDLENALARPAP